MVLMVFECHEVMMCFDQNKSFTQKTHGVGGHTNFFGSEIHISLMKVRKLLC